MIVQNTSREWKRQKDEELRQQVIAQQLAMAGVAIDWTGLKIAAPGELAVFEDDHLLDSGGSKFDYREGYPEGDYFEYFYVPAQRDGKQVRVIRIVPHPQGRYSRSE